MKHSQMLKTFTDRYPFVGPAIWMVNVQYFIVQFIVASYFTPHYSLMLNTISDLGNTVCGIHGALYVCSHKHWLMNASFILLGLTMITGSSLIYQAFKKSSGSFIGFCAITLAGVGVLLVGLFPENTVRLLHGTGAELVFICGNVGLVILGQALKLPKVLRIYTLLSGIMSLIALVLYTTNHYLGIGVGGMERIVAYPQTIWLIVFGIYVSCMNIRKRHNPHQATVKPA
jgi:hypothetical membrane protein